MNRRDFFKSLSLAVAAFAAYKPPIIPPFSNESKIPLIGPVPGFWKFDAKEQIHEVCDEVGTPAAIVSFGFRIKITKTTYAPERCEDNRLDAVTLTEMQSIFGLPCELADHLVPLGFNKFLTHERRFDWTINGATMEQDWVAWSDPELTEKLCTPCN